MIEIDNRIEIYTDGGCRPNPGPGAWSYVMLNGETAREMSGADENTTNNRMELLAVINALESLEAQSSVIIYCDSELTVNCAQRSWKCNKNSDLWTRFDTVAQTHTLVWEWVQGHAGNAWNERCHELVQALLPP